MEDAINMICFLKYWGVKHAVVLSRLVAPAGAEVYRNTNKNCRLGATKLAIAPWSCPTPRAALDTPLIKQNREDRENIECIPSTAGSSLPQARWHLRAPRSKAD